MLLYAEGSFPGIYRAMQFLMDAMPDYFLLMLFELFEHEILALFVDQSVCHNEQDTVLLSIAAGEGHGSFSCGFEPAEILLIQALPHLSNILPAFGVHGKHNADRASFVSDAQGKERFKQVLLLLALVAFAGEDSKEVQQLVKMAKLAPGYCPAH